MHIKIRNDLLAHLRLTADRTGKSMTRIIEDSLDDSFNGVSDEALARAFCAAADCPATPALKLVESQHKLKAAGLQ